MATLVCLDGNIPTSTINYVCSFAKKHGKNGKHQDMVMIMKGFYKYAFIEFNTMMSTCVTVWYEPTDSEKACKPFLSDAWKSLTYSSPNLAELCAMNKKLGVKTPEGELFYFTSI